MKECCVQMNVCFKSVFKTSVLILKETWREGKQARVLLLLPITPISMYHKLTLITNKNHYFPSFAFHKLHMCHSDDTLWVLPLQKSLPGENVLSRLCMP